MIVQFSIKLGLDGLKSNFFQARLWLQFLLFPSLKYFQRICRELIDELFHHDYFPFHKFYMKYERLRCRYAKIFIIFVLFFVTIYSPPLKYYGLDILFPSNHNIHKSLKPKDKDHKNFYECYNLTKKVYLMTHIFILKCAC